MRAMAETVSTKQGAFEIFSEARGAHWVAWIARAEGAAPEKSVVLVGETQAEALAKARIWAGRL
jgi:hypothetical protein